MLFWSLEFKIVVVQLVWAFICLAITAAAGKKTEKIEEEYDLEEN